MCCSAFQWCVNTLHVVFKTVTYSTSHNLRMSGIWHKWYFAIIFPLETRIETNLRNVDGCFTLSRQWQRATWYNSLQQRWFYYKCVQYHVWRWPLLKSKTSHDPLLGWNMGFLVWVFCRKPSVLWRYRYCFCMLILPTGFLCTSLYWRKVQHKWLRYTTCLRITTIFYWVVMPPRHKFIDMAADET